MQSELKEGEDFYFNESGLMVFTEKYHLMRGYCCTSGCLHCPYGFGKNISQEGKVEGLKTEDGKSKTEEK